MEVVSLTRIGQSKANRSRYVGTEDDEKDYDLRNKFYDQREAVGKSTPRRKAQFRASEHCGWHLVWWYKFTIQEGLTRGNCTGQEVPRKYRQEICTFMSKLQKPWATEKFR